jgi:superfamily II RNA helicase
MISPNFPFPLDAFQREAIASLDAGRSVVVCVPTGSGKTVVAEYAIDVALAEGRRVFYTTPLKALSNQKLRDLSARLGAERVGLLTGDVSLRRDAPVVVMTTEVCRNILYGVGRDTGDLPDLRFIILDECHYINDAHRGTVWEETVLSAPPEVRLVALSATIANPEQLTAWMTRAHGPTDLVLGRERPVPLVMHLFQDGRLLPLLRSPGRGAAPRLTGMAARHTRPWEMGTDADEVVALLRDRAMLPAIYFVFSRRGCEEALPRCGTLELLSLEEQAAIRAEIAGALLESPDLRHHPHLRFLRAGVAAHHAGLLPRWRTLVERLFQAGLVKVVFATETLAAGINMPARSTVISGLTKRAGREYRSLTPSEFTQMAGRAGRRGMDVTGHVVVVGDPFRPAAEAARLAAAPPDPLLSHFTPTYSMALNLLRRHSVAEAEGILRRSFGQFLADARRTGAPASSTDPAPGAYAETLHRLIAVLTERGYLQEGRPTEAGLLAATFRTENELLVAEIVRAGTLEALSAADLAAVLTALAAEPARPGTAFRAPVTAQSAAALTRMREIAGEVQQAQRRHRVDIPCRLVEAPCGLAQLWASGAAWEAVLDATDLDEGDVVYFLRSLIDLLGQLGDAPGLSPSLRQRARETIAAVDREPVEVAL